MEKIKELPEGLPIKVAGTLQEVWEGLTDEQKAHCVLEEAYVIGLERLIIPAKVEGRKDVNPFIAFKHGLEKVCTVLSSGWFQDWAINNYYYVLNMYNSEYVDKVLLSEDFLLLNQKTVEYEF